MSPAFYEICLQPQQLPRQLSVEVFHAFGVDMAYSRFLDRASEGKQLGPAFMTYCPFGMHELAGPVIGLALVHWEDQRERMVALECMRGILADINASRYSFWTEAWFNTARTQAEADDLKKTPPRDRADRKEMLFIVTVDKMLDDPLLTAFQIDRPSDGLPVLSHMDERNRLAFNDDAVLDLMK